MVFGTARPSEGPAIGPPIPGGRPLTDAERSGVDPRVALVFSGAFQQLFGAGASLLTKDPAKIAGWAQLSHVVTVFAGAVAGIRARANTTSGIAQMKGSGLTLGKSQPTVGVGKPVFGVPKPMGSQAPPFEPPPPPPEGGAPAKINLGGEGELPGYINVNPMIGNKKTADQIKALGPLVTGAATSLPFGAGTVSEIQSRALPSPVFADPGKVIAEVNRVLSPGGTVVLRSNTAVFAKGPIRDAFEAAGYTFSAQGNAAFYTAPKK